MLTPQELFMAIVVPLLVSSLIAAIGAWRRWTWAMPLAAGAGFIVSYLTFIRPKLPPADGNDWLFWLAIPLVALGVMDALVGKGWGGLLAGFAGVVAVVTLKPLLHDPPAPDGLTSQMLWMIALIATAASIVLALMAGFAQHRMGSLWVVMAFCVVTGGASVVIFSSNLRTSGLYGIAAAAALGPVAVLGMRMMGARSVAVFSMPLLAGLLVAGRFYPDPGVTWVNFGVLLGAPVLIVIGALLPLKRPWVRGAIALLAVTIAVGAVTGPTAMAAKEAAEKAKKDDPYGEMYK